MTIVAPEGATIHYTTDGSSPDENSPIYTEPITITSTTTIRAIAVYDSSTLGASVSATYVPTSSPSNGHSPRERFGIVVFDFRENTGQKTADLNVGMVRVSCDWIKLETDRGVFPWADNSAPNCADAIIRSQYLNPGTTVLVSVTGVPSWAGSGVMPNDLSDWRTFVSAFVTNYSGMNVILGIGNEFNLNGLTSAQYCTLFKEASIARNAADPTFRLAGPETSWHAIYDAGRIAGPFTDVMRCINGFQALAPQDIVVAHWYPDGPSLGDYMDAVHRWAGPHDVYLGEIAPVDTTNPTIQNYYYNVLMREFTVLSASRPWWRGIMVYRLWGDHYGILNTDFEVLPAFTTYQDWIASATGNNASALVDTASLQPNATRVSNNGLYQLVYQASDGNLVEYYESTAIWASNTGSSVGQVTMQGGNLVMFDANGSHVWDSGTGNSLGGYLVIHDNGDLVIYDSTGAPKKIVMCGNVYVSRADFGACQ